MPHKRRANCLSQEKDWMYLDWYKTLTIHQKINLKECFYLLFGVKWEELSFLFSIRERIELAYNKLKLEGII